MIKIPLPFGWSKEKKSNKIRTRKRQKNVLKKWIPTWAFILWWGVILLGIIGWFIQKRYTNPDNIIKNIVISEESKLIYDDLVLEKELQQYFSWTNFTDFSFTKKNEFNELIKDYPLVESIQVARTEDTHTVYIETIYNIPQITLSNKTNAWVVRENKTFKVAPADTIQDNTLKLRLPDNTDSMENLDGIFYHIHSDTLYTVVSNIMDIVDGKEISDILYIPWWQKLHISYKDKLILFHLDKSLDAQLAKLLDIKQYYSNFDKVSRIDLWSSDDIIVR